MKNIFIFTLAIALFASCSNKTEEKKETSKTEETKSSEKAEQKEEAPKLKMEDLVGTWQQTESAQQGGATGSGTLTLVLKGDGSFTETTSVAANVNTMGMNIPGGGSASQSGKWSLNDKTVDLGGLGKLEYHEDTKTLVNEAEKISLSRK